MPKFISFPVCSRAFRDVSEASQSGRPYMFFDGYTLREIDPLSFVFIYKSGYLNASQMVSARLALGILPRPIAQLWDHIERAVEVGAPITSVMNLRSLPTSVTQYGYALGNEQWNMLYFPSSVIIPATRAVASLEHAIALTIGHIKTRLLADNSNCKWWLDDSATNLLVASNLLKTLQGQIRAYQAVNELRHVSNLGGLLGIYANGRSVMASPVSLKSSINYKMIADINTIIGPAWSSITQLFALSQLELRQSLTATFTNLLNTIKPTLVAMSENRFSDKQLLAIVKGNLIGESL